MGWPSWADPDGEGSVPAAQTLPPTQAKRPGIPTNSWSLTFSGGADWDPDLAEVEFSGDFIEGAGGTLAPTKGPKSRWQIQMVEPDRRFVTATRLPGATVLFDHTVSDLGGERTVVHRITMTGRTTPLFSRVLGGRLAPQLDEAVANLALKAEAADAS